MNRLLCCILVIAGAGLASCSERGTNVPPPPKTTNAPAAPTAPAAPSTYRASLEEGITFAKPGYPEFVARVEGISQTEAFGRWTDGPKAVIVFKDPLPKKFDLAIKGAAYGPNINQPVKVTIGGNTQEVSFNSDLNTDPQTNKLSFALDQPADRIELTIPQPTQPTNGDVRKLGIALVELKVESAVK